jgi:ketopantoate reductase
VKAPVIIIGLGEMGGVFARGFLRSGYPVYPVTRSDSAADLAQQIPEPALVLLAVAENDLHPMLQSMPEPWHKHLALLQNELLPGDWQEYGYTNPTVISVWFEKKKGQDAKVLIPSPAFGPQAELLKGALGSIDIPVTIVEDKNHMLFELVRKNVYILTTNICGLLTGGTVGELWSQHRELAEMIAAEVIRIQEKLTGQPLPAAELVSAMVEAFEGDPQHKCTGRSAPARLQRALELADSFGVKVPRMKAIAVNTR